MELKNHWIRILILLSYFVLVFTISRILDLVVWCHHGYLPTDLVDPIVLNVRQLKQLLDIRGVSYMGVLEKPQLVELLNDSAHVLRSEFDEILGSKNNISQNVPPSTHFTGGSHFNEKVEDTKDSVWLVQVLPASKRKEPLLDDYSWHYLKHELAPFGVQTGVFDCALDRQLCIRRNWLEPILLLALPRGNRPKDHVIIRTSRTPKIHMIIKWVKEQLSSRVSKISSLAELEQDWLSPSASDSSIKVVLLSHLLHTPLFFAALSIKFSGRIKFGMLSVKRDDESPDSGSGVRKPAVRHSLLNHMPAYLVITPEKTHRYGYWPAEHFNLLQMNIFLKLVVPEINDIFLVALLLTNMLAIIDVCQMRHTSRLLSLVVSALLFLIGNNLILFSFSLLSYHFSLPLSPLLSLLRYVNFSYLGALVRSDLLSLYAHPIFFVGNFLTYSYLMGKKFPFKEETLWDVLPLGNSVFNFLFRPSEPPSRLFTSDVHFDLRFEQFVLSAPRVIHAPNLWLQTSVPRVDYISDLPVFEYKGWRPCPHKGMKMICRVMDGEEPHLLRDVSGNSAMSNTNVSNTERLSNTIRSTHISNSIENLRERTLEPSRSLRESSIRNHSYENQESDSLDGNAPLNIPTSSQSTPYACVRRRFNSSLSSPNCDLSNRSCSQSTYDTHNASTSRDSESVFTSEEVDCDYLECRLIRCKDCAICLEPYVTSTILLALPCAHHYHKSCILPWLQRVAQCPVCRWPAYDQKYDFSY